MSTEPLSVIVPAFNCEKTISQVIQSILDQDYPGSIELIVVDDGSTDDTARIVKSFPKVGYVHQQNSGPAVARNRGVQEATHQFLFFTDSDCVAERNWLKMMMMRLSAESVAA